MKRFEEGAPNEEAGSCNGLFRRLACCARIWFKFVQQQRQHQHLLSCDVLIQLQPPD